MTADLRDQIADALAYRPASSAYDYADRVLPIVYAYASQLLHEVADTSCKRGGIPDMILGADVRARAYELDGTR